MSKIELHKGDCLTVMDELIAKGVAINQIIDSPCFPIAMELTYDTKEIIKEINSEKNRNVAMDFFNDFMQRD